MKQRPDAQGSYLTQRELEVRWRLSGRTLERWRGEDHGPAWHVLGGSIRYRLDDVEAFEARQRRAASDEHLADQSDGSAE